MPAVTTEHEVVNLALGIVGQRQFLDSMIEETTEAEVARVFYKSTRNELLAAWHWRFATAREVLALTTEERTGWGYCYRAPTGMILPQRLWDGLREPGAGEPIPFSWELTDAVDGHLILTDLEEAELIYTRELATVALWPAYFVKAVASQLAVYLAGALPVKPELMPNLQRSATMALQMAAAKDANTAVRDVPADSEWIRER